MTYVDDYITGLENTLKAVSRSEVQAVVDFLFDALFEDRQVFIIGNGGSASTASHMMNDLSKLTIRSGKPRYRAIALTDNMPLDHDLYASNYPLYEILSLFYNH